MSGCVTDELQILLRAFESVSVSLSHLLVSHYLSPSTSQPVSANSSATDLTILTLVDDNECFTVSLDISEVSCQLSAADSTNNDRARNAFGTNPSPESKVRGIGFRLQWRNVALQCVSPGDTFNDKSQLIAVRQAEFEGLSTWRPSGWTREELLFASDPNLALIVGRASMASIDVAGDVQLFDELAQPWHRSRPRRTSNGHGTVQPARPAGLPPRIRMVLDVGRVMVLLADRVSEHQTTLSLASDGLHLSCFSGFSDVVGRRRDKATARSVFKQEDKLQQRRKEAGDEADYALPESMLKPQLRRQFSVPPARLDEEYALSMRADSALALEPMSLHLTLSGENSRSHKTYHLASIGRVHSTVSGDILGRQDVPPNASETASLDLTSLSCSVDLGIDQGIKINLWETAVLNALVAMAAQHNKSAPSRKRTDEKTSLCRLPSGVSARVSLGLLSVFVGHQDPNPKCPLKLTRGLWLQSSMTVEYAYYKHRSQAMLWRHPLHASQRAKLQLPEDITTQALAFFNHLSLKEGRAALLSFSPMDTIIKPIYNGQRFIEKGGTTLSHEKTTIAKEKEGEDFVGWEFRRPQAHTEPSSGNFANNVPPFEISDADQAQRPLIRIPTATINWLIQRPTSELRTEHKLTSKVGPVSIASDISHIYSTLLALLVVRKIAAAWKTVEPASEPRRPLNLSAEINFPSVTAHFAFPLKEQLILYFGGVSVSRPADGHMFAGVEQLLAYVPSSREAGSWEELGRIKRLGIKVSEPASPLAISIDADALRVRIPVGYQLSKLVLNLNVTVKAVKLLALDLGQKDFSTVHKPGPEAPKNVPKIDFNIKHMSLEAKDNPIETNLNLIWRAGLVEQETRNALEDAFEQKLQIISEKQDAEVSLNDEDEQLNGLLRSTKLTAKHAVPLEEARYRLDWWKSRSWVKRIRAAKQEQRRREATALKHMQNIGPDVRLPVTITASSQTAPLFRAALDGVKLSVCKADMSLPEILKYMSDVSSPFDDDVEFSLMVPLQLSLSMDQVTVKLRDYPLPLIRVQPATSGDRPAFHLETPFIIAEELRGDDSYMLVPCDVIPKGCGASQAAPFTVQMAKTITPVKTYSRPIINIASEKTTEFTWGNSYGPAIQDFMRVVDSLSHAPRDPSPKVGFWDKFRLILHWRVIVNFAGPAHLHLKGESTIRSIAECQAPSIHTQ